MMAIMVEQLNLEPGSRVLEIGAGTGYNAAILAHVVGETGSVITMDIDQDIVDEAAGNLAKTGYGNVKAICGDGFEGFPGDLPYDRITVTVGAYDISPHWVDQLKEGGVIVVPLWFKGCFLCVALEKREGGLRSLSASPCTFIPIRGGSQPTEGYFPIGDPPDDNLQMTIGRPGSPPGSRASVQPECQPPRCRTLTRRPIPYSEPPLRPLHVSHRRPKDLQRLFSSSWRPLPGIWLWTD